MAMLSQEAFSARILLIFISWLAVQSIFFGIMTSTVRNVERTLA
jgi:hypothetical protein